MIDFRAANIRSANAKALNTNLISLPKNKLLKTLVIYGANASGKSNIIRAIRFCHAMVFESHNHNQNTVFNFQPFKFDGFANKPSSYYIRFLLDGIEYEYAFSLTTKQIVTESLHYYPKGRIKEIFTRDERRGKTRKDKYTFTDVIRRPFDVAENTSEKTLYISRASQMDREIAKNIFNYFYSTFILDYIAYAVLDIPQLIGRYKKHFIEALTIADSDIEDVKIKVLKLPGKNIHADLNSMTLKVEDVMQDHLEIKTYHKKHPGVAFDFFTEESNGTIRLFFIMLTLLDVIKNNKILLIDEIEQSLHPKIIEYIFNLFHAGENAQLLCTTHFTGLLNLKNFRKDQIYFTNKGQDGSTDLYSLYDYKDFRETMDVEKAYLQGRFDAIPIIDDSIIHLKSLINGQ